MSRFGTTALLANPAAQLGKGQDACKAVEAFLRAQPDACETLDLICTKRPGHATEIAAGLAGYDTVIVIGGDGTVHETVNGLMRLAREQRPALALVPAGSGNDYARTLHMSRDIAAACEQLMRAEKTAAELGCCNGRYYAQTLSFGLDAAIALDTVQRRRRTGTTGLRLYAASCLDKFLHDRLLYDYRLRLDGGAWEEGQMYIFAVQVGPSYGSGFYISPRARIDDGLLDLCIAHPPLSSLKAALIFLRAKRGRHERYRQVDACTCTSLVLELADGVPAQIDGESITSTRYEIDVVPDALDVYRS